MKNLINSKDNRNNLKQSFILFILFNLINIYTSFIFVTGIAEKYKDSRVFKEVTSFFIQINISVGYIILAVLETILIYFLIRGIMKIRRQWGNKKLKTNIRNIIIILLAFSIMSFVSLFLYFYSVASVLSEMF